METFWTSNTEEHPFTLKEHRNSWSGRLFEASAADAESHIRYIITVKHEAVEVKSVGVFKLVATNPFYYNMVPWEYLRTHCSTTSAITVTGETPAWSFPEWNGNSLIRSVNSGNLMKRWSMTWSQFEHLVCYPVSCWWQHLGVLHKKPKEKIEYFWQKGCY